LAEFNKDQGELVKKLGLISAIEIINRELMIQEWNIDQKDKIIIKGRVAIELTNLREGQVVAPNFNK
jgi:hypothetical protein